MPETQLSAPVRRKPFLRGCLTVLLVLGGFFALLLIVSRMDEIPFARGEKVAVISVSGLISDSESTIEQLKKFVKDDSVKAIVLRINSPGGGVAPSQEIYEEVKKARAKKPVIASMGALAASGGYYIACATQRVYANPGTITGSIGVIMPFMNVKDLVEKIGLKGMAVKSGVFKDMGSPMRDMTPREALSRIRLERARAILQQRPGASVTEVAFECGFQHLGRFSRNYRQFHGELPSETARAFRRAAI